MRQRQLFSVNPGTSAKPTQADNIVKLIQAKQLIAGDAIYIEMAHTTMVVQHIWGILHNTSGLTTLYIKSSPNTDRLTKVPLDKIQHFCVFKASALSDVEGLRKMIGKV